MAGGRILIRPNRGWVRGAHNGQSQECGNPDPDMTDSLAFRPSHTNDHLFAHADAKPLRSMRIVRANQSWLYVYWGRLYAVAMGAQRAADWVLAAVACASDV